LKRDALIAEFIGTFALVFIAVGAIAADAMTGGTSGLVGIALANGLIIAVMVSATAAISGGHLNPAITIAALTVKRIDLTNAIGYILAQCLGAVVAAFLIKLAVPVSTLGAIVMGTPVLGNGITPAEGLVTEIVLTFLLMFVIYGTAFDRRAPKAGGLFIGLMITLGILMGGPISGAAMNPARYLGPALMGGSTDNFWIYWVGPVIGAVLAAIVYKTTLEDYAAS
jgi:aquaporin TIP